MSNTFLTKAIKLYFELGYYNVNEVYAFFLKQSNFDRGYLVLNDFEAITGISIEFYKKHKAEIGKLEYKAFQAWLENYKIKHPEEFVA